MIQPIFTMTIAFVLPLGWWLTAQTVTVRQVLEACVVVLGLSVFIVFGDPAGGRSDAPNWEWLVSIAVIALLCAGVLLQERLAPPTWHKAVAFAALGCALAAAVAISLSEERGRKTSLAGTEQLAPDAAA